MEIYKYPYSDKLNPRLYEIIEQRVCNQIEDNIPHSRTNWNLHRENIKEVNTLVTWVENLLPQVSFRIAKGEDAKFDIKTISDDLGFNPFTFKIHQCWGILYKKGKGVIEHSHFPYPLAFVYYVKTPSGCSPTIFEGKTIRPKEGELLLFEGYHLHRVPRARVNGRCIISGLILYAPHL